MAPPGLTIRAFQPGDALEVMRLFRNTVHNVNSRDYTPEQIEAWAPALMDEPRWHERLLDGLRGTVRRALQVA